MPTTILSDVDALRLELHALRARVDALEAARRRLSRSDHRLLARLLPAIVGTFGSDVFTANDVVTNPAPAIRIVIGDRSTKSVGRLLARAADAGAVDGLLVERDARQVNVTGWRVVGVSGH